MSECICNSCRNLKGVIGEDGQVEEYVCQFGFPSGRCEECEGGECSEACSHYACDEEDDVPRIIHCKGCGRELKKVVNDGNDGDAFCVECYLSNM